MTDHKLEITDEAGIQDATGAPAAPRKQYRVTDKVVRESTNESNGSEGLFKNGQVYKPGDTLELDEKTAANYIALGEVEELPESEQKAATESGDVDGVEPPAPGTVVQPEGGQDA